MRESDLARDLAAARDTLVPADQVVGRDGVDRRVQKHQRQRFAAVFAVVVLLVGGAAFGLSRTGAEEQGVITTPNADEDVPRIVPGFVPTGWTVDSVTDFGEMAAETSPTSMAPIEIQTFVMWTDSSLPDPATDARVVAATAVASGDGVHATGSISSPAVEDIEVWVDGETGQATWTGDDLSWTLSGRGVDEEFLRSLAAQIQGSEGVAVQPPEGFRELMRRGPYEVVPFLGAESMANPGPPSGYGLGFGATSEIDDVNRPFPAVTVMGGGESDPWITYLFGSDPLQHESVQGRPALLWRMARQSCAAVTGSSDSATDECTSEPALYRLVIEWSEDSTISVYGAGEDEVRQIAEGLREVDEATWQEFVATLTSSSMNSTATTMPASEISGQGTAIEPETGEPMPTTTLSDDRFEDVPATAAPHAGSATSTTQESAGSGGAVVPPG